jgi:hypothetical protein
MGADRLNAVGRGVAHIYSNVDATMEAERFGYARRATTNPNTPAAPPSTTSAK